METIADAIIVKVTRRGQTTIPLAIRKLVDMEGIDAGYGTPEEINKMIDKLREEY